uniref:Mitochondrial import inner membrane translocase subunit n=1 Tax=Romanomermis culicivorax TaxID=13658 RepID=A0A915HWK3_ROMCU
MTVEGLPMEGDLRTLKDFLAQYNRITELCFKDCISDFKSRETNEKETKCIGHCLEKFLKLTQRVSQRFQEYHSLQSENMVAAASVSGPLAPR